MSYHYIQLYRFAGAYPEKLAYLLFSVFMVEQIISYGIEVYFWGEPFQHIWDKVIALFFIIIYVKTMKVVK